MLSILKRRLQTEYYHFIKLGEDARKLLISFSFYELVQPLIFGFINAFLFRQNQNFITIVLYNTGMFISIPLFFFLNGILLKRFSLKRLYQLGLLGQGLVLNALFFIPTSTWLGLLGFGLLQGAFVGIYWANRNFMSLEITNVKNRQYFVGLEQISGIGSELLAPLIIGAVITLGSIFAFATPQDSYKILGVISFGLLVVAAKILGTVKVDTPNLKKVLVSNPSTQWWFVRLAEATYGSFHGVYMFLPSLLVFKLVGEEGVLGVMQSVAALFTAIVVYYFSRKMKPAQRVVITAVAIVVLIVLSLYLSVSFIALSAVLLILMSPGINHIRWLAWNPTVMSAIEAQDGGNKNTNYAYVVDREIFLNIGRLVGVAIFVLALKTSEEAAIRYSPIMIAVMQMLFIFSIHMVIQHHPEDESFDEALSLEQTTETSA